MLRHWWTAQNQRRQFLPGPIPWSWSWRCAWWPPEDRLSSGRRRRRCRSRPCRGRGPPCRPPRRAHGGSSPVRNQGWDTRNWQSVNWLKKINKLNFKIFHLYTIQLKNLFLWRYPIKYLAGGLCQGEIIEAKVHLSES